MYRYEYNDSEAIIYLVDSDETRTMLDDNMASEPILSKDKTSIAYISPLAWEEIGNIYITDLKTGETKKIYSGSSELTPKFIKWESNNTILVILGYPYGTVSVGGDIYRLNLDNGTLNKVVETSEKIEITSFEFKENKKVLLVSGVEYIDDAFNKSKEYKSYIDISGDNPSKAT